MSEIAACTLIQEEPDRKTERYMMMFKDYPDVVIRRAFFRKCLASAGRMRICWSSRIRSTRRV